VFVVEHQEIPIVASSLNDMQRKGSQAGMDNRRQGPRHRANGGHNEQVARSQIPAKG